MILRNRHLFYGIVIGLIPTIATIGLLWVVHQAELYQHVPTYSDEIIYWRETQTFLTSGFNGGYYTWSEQPAQAVFSRFYAHGPAFAVLTGSLANITGWYLYSFPVFNLIVLFLALLIFVYVSQPDRNQLIILVLTLITFWPVLLYTSLSMQESFNHAIAILLAAFFSVRFFSVAPPRWISIAILGMLFFAALIRPTWALLASTLFLIPLKRMSGRDVVIGLLKTAVFCSILFGISTYWNSPYPNVLANFFKGLSSSVGDGLYIIANNVFRNLYNIGQGNWLEIFQRLQIIALLMFILITKSRFRLFTRLKVWLSEKLGFTQAEILFHLLNLGVIFCFNIVIYDFFAWRDYRVLAPHLLLSILILISARRFKFALFSIAMNIVLFPAFVNLHYDLNTPSYSHDPSQFQSIAQQIEEHIPPYSSEESGWCRTVLSQGLPVEVLFFPADMGISFFVYPNTLTPPIRSKYLLLNEAQPVDLPNRESLEVLANINNLTLVYNPNSDCNK